MSKAAVNFFTAKIHHENPRLIAFPIHPGWVKTELGNSIATAIGRQKLQLRLKPVPVGSEHPQEKQPEVIYRI
ncbi:hypothetical protein AWENTII_001687 [Aspergillus wentii]